MAKNTTKNTKQRVAVKDLPKKSKALTGKDLKKVKGGITAVDSENKLKLKIGDTSG